MEGLIRAYLKSNGILKAVGRKRLIKLAVSVAGIPWGEGRTVEEVLVTKKVGTCTGKHLVLQACLDELGMKYRPVVCTFRWGEQKIRYPAELRRILAEGEWEHGHNFVQILREDGTWMDVDVTWNPRLKPCGFRAFPEDWDGRTSFVGVERIVRRWDGADMKAMKKELIDTLGEDVRERRERFIELLIEWVGSLNR